MAGNDSYSESNILNRQENEVEVIKSIFGNYCIDLRELEEKQQQQQQLKRKNKQQIHNERKLPLLRITLFPLNSQSQSDKKDIYVQIDLKVEFSVTYPNKLPKLTLENDKGLSIELKKQLQDDLIKKAKSLIGREMIYELCQEIQEFLYSHNKPPTKSFYDQMLDNKKRLVDYDHDVYSFDVDRKKFEDEHIEEINEALTMKRELLREEMKQKRKLEKRERLSSSTNSPSSHPKSGNSKNNSESSDAKEEEMFSKVNFTIDFTEPSSNKRKINCAKLIKHNKQYNFKVYRGIDVNSSDIYLVYEWSISLEKNKIFESKKLDLCLNEFKKIEEEIRKMIKLNNSSLVKYYAYKAYKQQDKPIFKIQLCLGYIEGNTLDLFLNKKSIIQYSTLQTYTIELIKILDYLHSYYVYHRDLKASCIYLDNNGSLKVSDYSTIKRINNLYELVVNEAQSSLTANAKTDFHQLGLLLLSLAIGEQINDYYPKIPNHLPPEIRNFITKCIHEYTDAKKLLELPFLTKILNENKTISNIKTSLYGDNVADFSKNASVILTETNQSSELITNSSNEPFQQNKVYTQKIEDSDIEKFDDYPKKSRLNTEFQVIGKVGSGAFGIVLKVKNRIDMCTYAIKRIRLNPNSNQVNKQITREIKLLSRLNHENVVRYFSTWYEKYEEENSESELTESTMNKTSDIKTSASTSIKKNIQQQQKKENNKKNLKKSSSFSSLLLKQSNFNFDISPTTNNVDFSDDGFSTPFLVINDNLNTVKTVSLSSSSHSSSSSSSESSSDNNDDSSSENDDNSSDSEKSSIIFHNSESENDDNNEKNKSVLFSLSPKKNSQLNKKKNKKKSIINKKIDNSDSIIFEKNEKKSDDGNNSENENDKFEFENKLFNNTPTKSHRLFVFIQMEFCEGKTLKDLIDKDLFNSIDRVWVLFREIVQGLNHIHEHGMIHRDLKPRNVLIDANGHAKIGDFGLATTNVFFCESVAANNNTQITNQQNEQQSSDGLHNDYQSTPHNQLDSTSLSGNVGTALYVAPELMTPQGKNKYLYTQKVDIYSLGIMFYEMCFPFSTNMERVNVILALRKKIFTYPERFDLKQYSLQTFLIEKMLDHDAEKRPTAQQVLEWVPREKEEIALDELLEKTILTRTSNNYHKILKTIFSQKNTLKDDVSYDCHNIKPLKSFKFLQIREYVHNTLTNIFQKNGAFMISYPLLEPTNELSTDYSNSFQLVDSSGIVLTLPYNHRIHFARYIARSDCFDHKRYFIGNVYQIYAEKFKAIGNHPRENTEATYDIVTSNNNDLLPEIEILWLLNDIICSFNELNEHEFILVINYTQLLNSIMFYAGIKQDDLEIQKKLYVCLAEYNKLFKIQGANIDNDKVKRADWLKEKFTKHLLFNENITNRLINFLIKYGTVEKVLNEMRNLTKNETQFARLAKLAISQIKFITQCLTIFDLKYEICVSPSFVLPLIANPIEYNGLLFALYRRKKKKTEYEIIASGGRYDRLINYFCFKKDQRKHYAIGVSIDFEKIVSVIFEKSQKQKTTANTLLQPQQISLPSSTFQLQLPIFINVYNTQTPTSLPTLNEQQSQQQQLLKQIDIKNRLCLFKYIYYLFKSTPICTPLIHENVKNIIEMDTYCKKNSIQNYVYLDTNESQSIQQTYKIFQSYQKNIKNSNNNQSNLLVSSSNNEDYNSSTSSEIYIRSLNNSKNNSKNTDIKYNLTTFLFNINKLLTDASTSLNFLSSVLSTNLSQASNNNSQVSTPVIIQYLDFVINLGTSSSIPAHHYYQQQPSSLEKQTNNISQVSITLLLESTARTSLSTASLNSSHKDNLNQSNLTSSNSNLNNLNTSNRNSNAVVAMKKLENQLVTRLTHILQLFSTRTRIELIGIEIADSVLQQLSNSIHLDCDEQQFNQNWNEFFGKLTSRFRKQITNFRLEETLRDLRYKGRSKVFIICSTISYQFKVFVVP